MTEKLLRRPAVEIATGLSRSTLYAMIADGKFPKSVLIGKRAVAWPESCVQKWIQERKDNA